MLLALAKAVANATAALVLKAKGVAGKCDEQEEQNYVIGSATRCALSTSQLVACTKVVAPTIHNPSCQEQLIEAAKYVAKSVDEVVGTAQVGGVIKAGFLYSASRWNRCALVLLGNILKLNGYVIPNTFLFN